MKPTASFLLAITAMFSSAIAVHARVLTIETIHPDKTVDRSSLGVIPAVPARMQAGTEITYWTAAERVEKDGLSITRFAPETYWFGTRWEAKTDHTHLNLKFERRTPVGEKKSQDGVSVSPTFATESFDRTLLVEELMRSDGVTIGVGKDMVHLTLSKEAEVEMLNVEAPTLTEPGPVVVARKHTVTVNNLSKDNVLLECGDEKLARRVPAKTKQHFELPHGINIVLNREGKGAAGDALMKFELNEDATFTAN